MWFISDSLFNQGMQMAIAYVTIHFNIILLLIICMAVGLLNSSNVTTDVTTASNSVNTASENYISTAINSMNTITTAVNNGGNTTTFTSTTSTVKNGAGANTKTQCIITPISIIGSLVLPFLISFT